MVRNFISMGENNRSFFMEVFVFHAQHLLLLSFFCATTVLQLQGNGRAKKDNEHGRVEFLNYHVIFVFMKSFNYWLVKTSENVLLCHFQKVNMFFICMYFVKSPVKETCVGPFGLSLVYYRV